MALVEKKIMMTFIIYKFYPFFMKKKCNHLNYFSLHWEVKWIVKWIRETSFKKQKELSLFKIELELHIRVEYTT